VSRRASGIVPSNGSVSSRGPSAEPTVVDIDEERTRLQPANVSVGGAFITTDVSARVGSQITVRHRGSGVEAEATVVWARAGSGVGVRWNDDIPRVEALLASAGLIPASGDPASPVPSVTPHLGSRR
jgi:hypothetical protein